MFCPKCGAKNPDGSRFCGECGASFAPAPAPAPAPTQAPMPTAMPPQTQFQTAPHTPMGRVGGFATGSKPSIAGMPFWSFVSLVALVLAGIFLFLAWAEVPIRDIVQQIYTNQGSSYSSSSAQMPSLDSIPASFGVGILALCQIASTLLSGVTTFASAAMALEGHADSTLTTISNMLSSGSFGVTIAIVAWFVAFILIVVSVTLLLRSKGTDTTFVIPAGIVVALLAIAWCFYISQINSSALSLLSLASSSTASLLANVTLVQVTIFVWLSIVAGVVAAGVQILQKLGIIH